MAPEVAHPPTIHDTAPEEQDLPCPMCDYNLRGLIDPRCPECGYTFLWIDLLDPRRRLHPYLFEHHPRRNTWSFFRTLFAGLRPARFWSSLLPSQPSRSGRLWAYAVIVSVLAFLGVIAEIARTMLQLLPYRNSRVRVLDSFSSSLQWALQINDAIGPLIVITLIVPAWGILTYWALLIFGTSMDMAKVNPTHVRRCVIYSFDVGVWFGLVAVIIVAVVPRRVWSPGATLIPWAAWALLATLLVFAYRMCQAYRKYMQFHRPVATVIASQVIVALIVLNTLLIFLVSR